MGFKVDGLGLGLGVPGSGLGFGVSGLGFRLVGVMNPTSRTLNLQALGCSVWHFQ